MGPVETLAHYSLKWLRERRLVRSLVSAVFIAFGAYQVYGLLQACPHIFGQFFAITPKYEKYHDTMVAFQIYLKRGDEIMNSAAMHLLYVVGWWSPWMIFMACCLLFIVVLGVVKLCEPDEKAVYRHM